MVIMKMRTLGEDVNLGMHGEGEGGGGHEDGERTSYL